MRLKVFLLLVPIIILGTNSSIAYAGTLNCTVSTSCPSGTVIFRMSNTTNAHTELPNQSNYSQLVCCSGVAGLGTSCSGTSATVLKLSGETNAHVEQNSQANYANNVCLSVPSGGNVSVGYQSTDCTGFDTILGSMSSVTNAHVGEANAVYTTKICATASGVGGTLGVDMVDSGGNPVSSPVVVMSTLPPGFSCQTPTSTLGASDQKIRVSNTTAGPTWTLTVAATDGPTALWSAGTPKYDFNDGNGSPAGCSDGGDSDSYAGQITLDPSVGTVTPQGGCSTTGLSLGSSAAFSEGTTDSITLLSASASANTNCYWDLTGVSVSQKIPAEQSAGSYSINMTLTITAS